MLGWGQTGRLGEKRRTQERHKKVHFEDENPFGSPYQSKVNAEPDELAELEEHIRGLGMEESDSLRQNAETSREPKSKKLKVGKSGISLLRKLYRCFLGNYNFEW